MATVTRTQVTPTVLVHVDRTPGSVRRGRAATIFVDYAEATAQEVRDYAAAFLLPGEFLQGDCLRKTGLEDIPNRFEFAVFA